MILCSVWQTSFLNKMANAQTHPLYMYDIISGYTFVSKHTTHCAFIRGIN
jgi:hypothetical protein